MRAYVVRKGLAVLLAPIGVGCSSFQAAAPPIVEVIDPVIVRAWRREDAERVTALRLTIEPRVRALLGERRRSPEVWLIAERNQEFDLGAVWAGKILLSPDSRSKEDLALAHELAHWYCEGAWNRLPPIVEEGLADLVAAAVLPRWRLAIPLAHKMNLEAVQITDLEPLPLLEGGEWLALDDERRALELRAIGYAFAARIGIDRLRRLCQQAQAEGLERIPAARLLESADIDPADESGLSRAISVTLPTVPGQASLSAGHGSS